MRIALVSSGYIHCDPRYLFLAQSFREAGYEVILLNFIMSSSMQVAQSQDYQIFRDFEVINFQFVTVNKKNFFKSLLNYIVRKKEALKPYLKTKKVLKKKLIILTYLKDKNFFKKTIKIKKAIKNFLRERFLRKKTILKKRLKNRLFLKKFSAQMISKIFFRSTRFFEKAFLPRFWLLLGLIDHRTISLYVEDILSQSMAYSRIAKVDIFYGLELFYGGLFAMSLANFFNKRLIVDIKEVYSEMNGEDSIWYKRAIKKIEEKIMKQSIVLPCVSGKIIEYFSEIYPKEYSKFVLLENAYQFRTYEIDFHRYQEKIKLIISAGVLDESRGIFHLLKIWEKLNPNNAELHLRIKKKPNNYAEMLRAVAPNTFQKTVFILPPVIEDEMVSTLLPYDIGIIPYLPDVCLNHLYCCPNKFGQYANAGLAIVSTNSEYIPPKIQQNKLGMIYDPYDLEGSVKKFQQFLSDRKALNHFRENAYQFTKEQYNWEIAVKLLLAKLNQDWPLKIALLYIKNSHVPQTVGDNLKAFPQYSRHQISLIPYNNQAPIKNLTDFDVVVIHYHAQVYTTFSARLTECLSNFKGLKVAFAQDDYDLLDMNRTKYQEVGLDILFSAAAINENIREVLYPHSMFPSMEVINCLPGYATDSDAKNLKLIKDRNVEIFYRGNTLGVAYGKLGYEKIEIGTRMKNYAERESLTHDIEVCISKQIYGADYLNRMRNTKCTLVTESGSSIIDHDLKIRSEIIKEIKNNPNLSFDYFVRKYPSFYQNDGKYVINTIPPKAFEAIICKTAIIAYEGTYSEVLIPDNHYILLRKDWSNIDEVLKKVKNNAYLQDLVDRAYHDIVVSGKYSYKKFIEMFDEKIWQGFQTKQLSN